MTQFDTRAVPPPDDPSDDSLARDVLRDIGLEPLIDFLQASAYGVCITGVDHTWVYLNPAAEQIIGQPLNEVQGRDYLLHFAEHERAALLELEGNQRAGDTDFYMNTVVRLDGSEVEMTWSGAVMEVDGLELAPAIFHETTPMRRAPRTAAEVVANALADGPADKARILQALVSEAASGPRVSIGFVLLSDPGSVRLAAQHGLPESAADEVAQSEAVFTDIPGADDLLRGRSIYLSDAHRRYADSPGVGSWSSVLDGAWNGAAQFPVWRDGEVAGCFVLLLAPDVTSPSESALAYWSSLADQASIAIGTDAIRRRASESSALSERSRIARDLHDSVSQGLFALQAHAQAVRRGLTAGNLSVAMEAAGDLETLARQATLEMRQLLMDLRPDVDEATDLAEALRSLVQRVADADHLDVDLTISPVTLPAVPPATAEHVCRIIGEALHNVVKHAAASAVEVNATVENRVLTVRVRDDGVGFDGRQPLSGLGQSTMRERAGLCRGQLSVVSRPGDGTAVELVVPLV
ncbi:MAG TPA: histidine kinase [Nocardioidaceae bacterium]|nr:histidine kinase [Nocardioidaceae bacterium]